jgi:hypothetical protein
VFVVSEAVPLPTERDRVLPTLSDPHIDFRRQVFLEDWQPNSHPSSTASSGTAAIQEYLPNRVVVDVTGTAPGYLVLTDIWFPGWTCTVDGQPARLYRANYLFRAVAVDAGNHQVVFTFMPAAYQRGQLISGVALVVVAALGLFALVRRWRRRGVTSGSGQAEL